MDWFKKQTKDLLFQKQVPKYNGGGTYWVNQGKPNNTGVEMSLTTFPVKRRDMGNQSECFLCEE